jgi:hypothetical protein
MEEKEDKHVQSRCGSGYRYNQTENRIRNFLRSKRSKRWCRPAPPSTLRDNKRTKPHFGTHWAGPSLAPEEANVLYLGSEQRRDGESKEALICPLLYFVRCPSRPALTGQSDAAKCLRPMPDQEYSIGPRMGHFEHLNPFPTTVHRPVHSQVHTPLCTKHSRLPW